MIKFHSCSKGRGNIKAIANTAYESFSPQLVNDITVVRKNAIMKIAGKEMT